MLSCPHETPRCWEGMTNTDRFAAKQTKIMFYFSIILSLLKFIDLNDKYGFFFPRQAITVHCPNVKFANIVVTLVFYCNRHHKLCVHTTVPKLKNTAEGGGGGD